MTIYELANRLAKRTYYPHIDNAGRWRILITDNPAIKNQALREKVMVLNRYVSIFKPENPGTQQAWLDSVLELDENKWIRNILLVSQYKYNTLLYEYCLRLLWSHQITDWHWPNDDEIP